MTRLHQIDGCVFIVTYGRSGSTLLQRVMQTVPAMCFRGENCNVLEMLFKSARCASRTRNSFGTFKLPPKHPWYGANNIEPPQFSSELARAFISDIIRPGPEHRWIGFKEIRYHDLDIDFFPYLDWIFDTFPNPYFLFNVRDHRQVARSGWWVEEGHREVMSLLKTMDVRFALYHKKRPDRSFINDYGSLTRNPASIKPFFKQTGLPYDAGKISQVMQEQLTH